MTVPLFCTCLSHPNNVELLYVINKLCTKLQDSATVTFYKLKQTYGEGIRFYKGDMKSSQPTNEKQINNSKNIFPFQHNLFLA